MVAFDFVVLRMLKPVGFTRAGGYFARVAVFLPVYMNTCMYSVLIPFEHQHGDFRNTLLVLVAVTFSLGVITNYAGRKSTCFLCVWQ